MTANDFRCRPSKGRMPHWSKWVNALCASSRSAALPPWVEMKCNSLAAVGSNTKAYPLLWKISLIGRQLLSSGAIENKISVER